MSLVDMRALCDAEFGEHDHDDAACGYMLAQMGVGDHGPYEEDDAYYDENYIGDEYYSGTGELIGDTSYEDYLNNY